jgi:hypothetical protein
MHPKSCAQNCVIPKWLRPCHFHCRHVT